jgi:DNA-directed RNA polymerase subunit RPC12/RpoP
MNLGPVLLGLPIFGAATWVLWRITRRLPQGWPGVGVGLGALILVPGIALGAWLVALAMLTTASYVCLTCGRVERQERFLCLPCSSTVLDTGEEYVRRFDPAAGKPHSHDWHLDGCIRSAGRVSCTMQYAEGWFRVLPKLQDLVAADELIREAQALPQEQRLNLMRELSSCVWIRTLSEGDLDRAFADWRAQRRSR